MQVPIQRMDAPRPAPADVEAGKMAQRAAPKKRRQAVAGGSTVLAALFCLFIYCGIGIPRVGVPTRELKYPILAQSKALQFERGQALGDLTSGGRALQAADLDGKPKIDSWPDKQFYRAKDLCEGLLNTAVASPWNQLQLDLCRTLPAS